MFEAAVIHGDPHHSLRGLDFAPLLHAVLGILLLLFLLTRPGVQQQLGPDAAFVGGVVDDVLASQ